MRLYHHFIISVILTAILYPFYGAYALLAMLTGFFIDVDHYFIYIYRFKDLNLIKAYKYLTTVTMSKKDLFLFHSVELLIIALFFIFYNFIQVLVIAFIVHMICDAIEEIFVIKQNIKTFSFIRWLWIKTRAA